MKIWDGAFYPNEKSSCYGSNEELELKKTEELCETLGIKLHIVDCAKEYKKLVINNFREEYYIGHTPNPCVICNQKIKFGVLMEACRNTGIPYDYFATGHYANAEYNEDFKCFTLSKASDIKKDQSYFLYRLNQTQLSCLLFPLGKLTKQEVYKIAIQNHLPFADKNESQDFYSGDIKDLLNFTQEEGEITDRAGNILGKHTGLWNYTIGQRKGIGISNASPFYVIDLDKKNNLLIVGKKEELLKTSCYVSYLNWILPFSGKDLKNVFVKIRYNHPGEYADIRNVDPKTIEINFNKPQESITPGQSAVFYSGNLVIGGGIIIKKNEQNL
jgi:tRNA-uridine 2-sulfurtransferase